MTAYQQLLQNLISQKGWGEPKQMGGSFDWEFTHEDGRKRRFQTDIMDAYSDLMEAEGYDLHHLEALVWEDIAKAMLPEVVGLELEIDDSGDTFEHGSEPGAWIEVTGRIWVPLDKAIAVTSELLHLNRFAAIDGASVGRCNSTLNHQGSD